MKHLNAHLVFYSVSGLPFLPPKDFPKENRAGKYQGGTDKCISFDKNRKTLSTVHEFILVR